MVLGLVLPATRGSTTGGTTASAIAPPRTTARGGALFSGNGPGVDVVMTAVLTILRHFSGAGAAVSGTDEGFACFK